MQDLYVNFGQDYVEIVFLPIAVFLIFFLHEMGHYIAARLCGVRILSVNIGFGPRVMRYVDRRGTKWSLRYFPLSGQVQLAGRNDEEACAIDDRHLYCARPLWQRMAIVFAGPLMNIILAFMFLTMFMSGGGIPSTRPVMAGVEIDSPAARGGLQPGDLITAVNGRPVQRYEVVDRIMNRHGARPMRLRLQRGEDIVDTTVLPEWLHYTDQMGFERKQLRTGGMIMQKPLYFKAIQRIDGTETDGDEDVVAAMLRLYAGDEIIVGLNSTDGTIHDYRVRIPQDDAFIDDDMIYFAAESGLFYHEVGWFGALAEAAHQTRDIIRGVVRMPLQMFPLDKDSMKPQTTVLRQDGPAAYDFYLLCYMAAFMSVWVGFFNLLPLPGLDGGKLIHQCSEMVCGPAQAAALAPYVQRLAFLIMAGIVILANASDFAVHFGMVSAP